MARYIDADKLNTRARGNNSQRTMWREIKEIVDNAPTADVAPKSEVDRWRRNLEAVLEERAETKQEIAREIFEEMFEKLNHIVITADVGVEYNTFKKTIKQVCAAVSAELAELKKKYTGEKE